MNAALPKIGFRYSYLYGIGVFVAWLLLLLNLLWTLNKGLVFNDEAWELLHYQNGAHTIDYSNWHRVFEFLYNENLVHLRQITFFLISISSFFLGFVSSRVFRFVIPPWVTGLLFNIFYFFLVTPVMIVPSYRNINFILISLSVSFLLLFLNGGESKLNYAYLLFSAFFISILPFVLVTNTPVIGVELAVLFFLSKPNTRVRYCLVFISGLLIYPIIYFSLVQSPLDFWNKYQEATHYLSFEADYGFFGILKWHLKLIIHFIQLPLLIFLSSIILFTKKDLNKYVRFILVLLTGSGLTWEIYSEATNSISMFPVTLWYLLFFALLYFSKRDLWQNKVNLILILFFASLPYFASLGSVVRFQYKASFFFPFLAVSIGCLLHYNKVEPLLILRSVFGLFLVCLITFFSYNFRSGWSSYNVFEQNQVFKLNDIKGPLFLNPERVAELNNLKPFLENNQYVMVSHENVWGYVYLLNARPVYLPFRFKEDYFYYFIDKHHVSPYQITYVELKRKPFPDTFKFSLNEKESSDYSLKKLDRGEFLIYMFQKKEPGYNVVK